MTEISPTVDKDTNTVLRTAFVKALPSSIKQHLVLQPDQSLTNLAALADKLAEFDIEQSIHEASMPQEQQALAQSIMDIKHELNAIKHRDASRQDSDICYYHMRFGSKANKCQQPCQWEAKNKAGKDQGSH